ncbi:MAG: protein-tyrosine phosphatase family protein [Acidimicrobiales bacterium]
MSSDETWGIEAGVLVLADGRRVRGRGLRNPMPAGGPPEFGLYLLGKEPSPTPWPSRWLRWPDFRLPADPAAARDAFVEVHERCLTERVEVACGGGRGRTGTALACLCVLAGTPSQEALAFVREHYDRHAVETPWQRRYVRRFKP